MLSIRPESQPEAYDANELDALGDRARGDNRLDSDLDLKVDLDSDERHTLENIDGLQKRDRGGARVSRRFGHGRPPGDHGADFA